MVEKFNLSQVVVLLYRSKKMCMPNSKVVQIFFRGHFVTPPTKTQWYYTICECRNIYGREVAFLFILGWNIILLDQTKVKHQQECHDGPKSLTWVSECHCSNCLCCRNSVWASMGFNSYNLGHHLPCQISCIWGMWFWRRRFQYFPVYFLVRIQDTLRRIHIGPWSHYVKQLSELSSSGEKEFLVNLLTSPGSPGIEPFWTNMVKDH